MDIDDILAEALHVAAPQETLDLQELTRAWVAERVAPELLPYPDALIERVLARIRKQIETVEEQTGNMDPKTNFRLIVIQTELERFKFLVRSFLRARVAKIDKYPLHVQQKFAHYLSPSESQYLAAHQTLLASHYQSSFLSQFPNSLQKLDDTQGGISMIDAPDADAAVFCRALRDVGDVIVEGAGIIFQMKRGDIRVVRWSAIRDKVLAGDMELV